MLTIDNISKYIAEIKQAKSLDQLEKIHILLLAKNGFFAHEMKKLSTLSIAEKKELGQKLNLKKQEIQKEFNLQTAYLKKIQLEEKLKAEYVDLSLPIEPLPNGGIHPISKVTEQMVNIFGQMGFSVRAGTEIEDDWYNFSALNIQETHPARQDHDTFYLNALDANKNRKVLRTHTSNVQIRTMLAEKDSLTQGKPIKIISTGRTYRSDSDSTHSPMFHQLEGLYIDKIEKISIPLLFNILQEFCETFFALSTPMRFRPSYFPFTSPSFEVDIACTIKNDALQIGIRDKWLEILGSGLVHTNVLKNCGIDSEKYAGLAFGIGIERMAMLKYGFKDLRSFFNSDVRWLQYYNLMLLKYLIS